MPKWEDLDNFKWEVDRLYGDKLVELAAFKIRPVPVDFKKLNDAVEKKLLKKYIYYAKIKNIEDKTSDVINLASTAALNTKINEINNEIRSITNLANNVSPNAKINEAQNKMPSISKKTTMMQKQKILKKTFPPYLTITSLGIIYMKQR